MGGTSIFRGWNYLILSLYITLLYFIGIAIQYTTQLSLDMPYFRESHCLKIICPPNSESGSSAVQFIHQQ